MDKVDYTMHSYFHLGKTKKTKNKTKQNKTKQNKNKKHLTFEMINSMSSSYEGSKSS